MAIEIAIVKFFVLLVFDVWFLFLIVVVVVSLVFILLAVDPLHLLFNDFIGILFDILIPSYFLSIFADLLFSLQVLMQESFIFVKVLKWLLKNGLVL